MNDEYEALKKQIDELKAKTADLSFDDMFEQFSKDDHPLHWSFNGKYTDKLVDALGHEPDGDEILMLIDNSLYFYYYGGNCKVNGNRYFYGDVYKD